MGQTRRGVTVWNGSYYPDAGELTGWSERAGGEGASRDPVESVGDRLAAIFADPAPGAGSARDPEPGAHPNRQRSGRRARSRLRRYAAANRLDRLVVLTYRGEGQHDLRACKRDVRNFIKHRLRGLVGPDMAYAVTWELHPSGHGWHVNLLLGAYVRHARLERAWGHGYVWVTRFKAVKGGSGRDAARAAARYVAKYAGKDVEGMAARVHRVEVAQGFQPAVVRLFAGTFEGLWSETAETDAPRYVWRSVGEPDHRGPPVAFASWL